ncbi:MAG: ATP-dependent Clp protease ATP-binding subunit ClpA [Candidatus Krumholzibacteriia bacterium]|jgi:ATP-dependent Clp protease ATP-binding subunit ClpA
MLIWTKTAVEVLRDATAKAEKMNHSEVHPLHLLWAATGRVGLDALHNGIDDNQQAKLRYQVERDLNRLPTDAKAESEACSECATHGFKMQQLLLRAAGYSRTSEYETREGQIGLPELMKALLQVDHRAASLLKAGRNRDLAQV